VKTKLSIDAGGYICNAAFFQALEAARKTGTPKRVAFVHIPWPRGWEPGKAQKTGAALPSLKALNRLAEEILRALIADLSCAGEDQTSKKTVSSGPCRRMSKR
jgi:pyrrolidone-carboxylate peptidase